MRPDPLLESEIAERMPVWRAFSEFFLDAPLDDADYRRIARILAASPYSDRELNAILVHEVRPVCRWNMGAPAGAWRGFDEEDMRRKFSGRLHRRPLFHLGFRDRWMYRRHWDAVRGLLPALRGS